MGDRGPSAPGSDAPAPAPPPGAGAGVGATDGGPADPAALAALVLDSPGAVRVTLASIIGTTAVSLVFLTFFYDPIRVGTWRLHSHFVKSPLHLVAFTAALFAIPVAVIAVSTFGF